MFVQLSKIVCFGCLCLAVLLSGCDYQLAVEPQKTHELGPVAGTVSLTVDFGDGRSVTSGSVPCTAGSTVFDILVRAQNMDDLEFESQGAGVTAFVKSIDGVKNQMGSGKNWVFRVNGALASRGCGVLGVAPGDQVDWVFGDYISAQD